MAGGYYIGQQSSSIFPSPRAQHHVLYKHWCSAILQLAMKLKKTFLFPSAKHTNQVLPNAPFFSSCASFYRREMKKKIERGEAERLLIFNPFLSSKNIKVCSLCHSIPLLGTGRNWPVRPQVMWIKHTLKKTSLVNIIFSQQNVWSLLLFSFGFLPGEDFFFLNRLNHESIKQWLNF